MKIRSLSGFLKDKRKWSTRTRGGHTDERFWNHRGLMEAKAKLLKKEALEVQKSK